MPASNMAGPPPHTPVLYQQVLQALKPSAGGRYIDATIGAGGHAFGILEASSPDGLLLGIDADPHALQMAETRLKAFGDRLILRHGYYSQAADWVQELSWQTVAGVLMDLGLSSMQLEDPERGFSFQEEGPLDMRFNPTLNTSAWHLVNEWPEEALADVIHRYGEERRSRRIARSIVEKRPISSTTALAAVIARARGGQRSRIHPATRTFQALRIAVNDELNELHAGLDQSIDLLESGGRLVVISFHSLEDRIVKRFIRRESRDCICPPDQPVCTCEHEATLKVLTRKPVQPDEREIRSNPRARSARLRAAERL